MSRPSKLTRTKAFAAIIGNLKVPVKLSSQTSSAGILLMYAFFLWPQLRVTNPPVQTVREVLSAEFASVFTDKIKMKKE